MWNFAEYERNPMFITGKTEVKKQITATKGLYLLYCMFVGDMCTEHAHAKWNLFIESVSVGVSCYKNLSSPQNYL